jgi:predicted Zn-dependent protease
MLSTLFKRRWCALMLIPGLLLCPSIEAQEALRLPALGDGAEWGVGEERQLGDNIMSQIWRDPDVIEDPVLLQYMQNIWNPLLATAREKGEGSVELSRRFAWEMFLVRDRSVNAFALPGGYMGVHLGAGP